MEGLARESPLLSHFEIHRIPNGVDLDVYRPVDRAKARLALGLDPSRPTVLFSAPDLDDPRKGGQVLEEALSRLDDVDFELIVTGGRAALLPRRSHHLGMLSDERELALSYAAADVFVLPTLADNLPNAVLESLACGTPCVSFAVGGIPDATRHLETGYLAPSGDSAGLAEGIRTLLLDGDLRLRLSGQARETVEREFGSKLEARRFAELYATLAPVA
jgi:glycosyltransferase involved in cell wall biosynthesis